MFIPTRDKEERRRIVKKHPAQDNSCCGASKEAYVAAVPAENDMMLGLPKQPVVVRDRKSVIV